VNFERHQDTIYATGFFSQICGEATSFIAQWNGDSWEPASWGISDPGHSLRSIGNRLFIARYEESIDSNWVHYYEDGQLSKWGEGVFLSTASGFSELPNIYDIIEYNGTLIACGEFDRVGNQEIEGIMQWNGDLYIAGWLKEITYSDNSTELCGGLVRYNNETLETFQGGVPNNDIEAIIQSSANLLIGGGVFNSGYVGQLDLMLSTKNTQEPALVSVFPTPFWDRLELSVQGFETFELVNVQGQCIQSGQIANTTIQVNPIPPGHYVLKLYGPNQQTTLRVQRQ
jgi:hypothetical protein